MQDANTKVDGKETVDHKRKRGSSEFQLPACGDDHGLTTTQNTKDDNNSLKETIKKKKTSNNVDDQKDKEEEEGYTYTENELKSKLRKDLVVICQSLDIKSSSLTKDILIQRIIDAQNKRLEFKLKMVDNNPLYDYNKGLLEYSLPWPIIGRILDLVWTESTICTCYYSSQFVNEMYQKAAPELRSMWEVYKELRMECPMHSYHWVHFNSLDFSETLMLDKNRWRYLLLGLSKRVYQFLTSKHCTSLTFENGSTSWQHITNPYFPIKSPKVVRLQQSEGDRLCALPSPDTTVFSLVEKLQLDCFHIIPPHTKSLPILFKNIKSLTGRNDKMGDIRETKYYTKLYTPQFITSFKNLTSLNCCC
ncbi:hypothetical protein DFA_06342 [Cavenderia fasciculata]|uniref:Uncharacterized protein n=1 Tax=Cavenderia fasciculata TaxID=261658 RepID=F4PKS1_CACFS|nr:uncharacterized protein DFA_06342 [Cavenderia fasciculata]EGG24195.1 hypothetical protein DFA_06342 [Cavenderia fasciculata]|eukprot:XP_004362046.1 hypothetical protein DFA_06342 [Cavenderia fasciculata]